MKIEVSKSLTSSDLLELLNSCFPNSKSLVSPMFPHFITIDINYEIKFHVQLIKPNEIYVTPDKIWFISSEMRFKAQEIALKLKKHINNGALDSNFEVETLITCPSCKSPNSNKLSICEWCGAQIN